jgi:hypothetical protein
MSQRWTFTDQAAFVAKLAELTAAGVPTGQLRLQMPYFVHEAAQLCRPRPSRLKFFTLAGAGAGLAGGFAFTIFTALDWPLRTGGKPIVSLPPFLIIAFELTILLGTLASFAGYLWLSRLPALHAIITPPADDEERPFVIELTGDAP